MKDDATQWLSWRHQPKLPSCQGDIILLNTARSLNLTRAKRSVKIDFITFRDGRVNNFKIAY